jgi:hypothetical protein
MIKITISYANSYNFIMKHYASKKPAIDSAGLFLFFLLVPSSTHSKVVLIQ